MKFQAEPQLTKKYKPRGTLFTFGTSINHLHSKGSVANIAFFVVIIRLTLEDDSGSVSMASMGSAEPMEPRRFLESMDFQQIVKQIQYNKTFEV